MEIRLFMANNNSEIAKNYLLTPLDTTTDALNGTRGSQILLMVLQRILHPWRIWRSWTLWWTSLSFNYDRVRGHASRVSFRLTSAPVPASLSELTRRSRWVYDEGKLYRLQPQAKHTYYSRKGLQIAVLQTQCRKKCNTSFLYLVQDILKTQKLRYNVLFKEQNLF